MGHLAFCYTSKSVSKSSATDIEYSYYKFTKVISNFNTYEINRQTEHFIVDVYKVHCLKNIHIHTIYMTGKYKQT